MFMETILQSIFNNPVVLMLFLTWSIVWKGFGMWRAAQIKSKPWFIALLVVNTAGILDILYIFIFSKKGKPTSQSKPE